MHERLVQETPLVRRHAPIFAGLPVEDQIDGDKGSAHQAGADEEALRQSALVGFRDFVRLLHVVSAEGGLERMARFGERGHGRFGL